MIYESQSEISTVPNAASEVAACSLFEELGQKINSKSRFVQKGVNGMLTFKKASAWEAMENDPLRDYHVWWLRVTMKHANALAKCLTAATREEAYRRS